MLSLQLVFFIKHCQCDIYIIFHVKSLTSRVHFTPTTLLESDAKFSAPVSGATFLTTFLVLISHILLVTAI